MLWLCILLDLAYLWEHSSKPHSRTTDRSKKTSLYWVVVTHTGPGTWWKIVWYVFSVHWFRHKMRILNNVKSQWGPVFLSLRCKLNVHTALCRHPHTLCCPLHYKSTNCGLKVAKNNYAPLMSMWTPASKCKASLQTHPIAYYNQGLTLQTHPIAY